MAEPEGDDREIDADLPQEHRAGVPEHVRGDAFKRERAAIAGCGGGGVFGEELGYRVGAERPSAPGGEQRVVRPAPAFAEPLAQDRDGLAGQRCAPLLSSFALAADVGAGRQDHI